MDNDKYVKFESARVAEFELVEAIHSLEDSIEENRKAYISRYAMLQDYDVGEDVLEHLTSASELIEASLKKALAHLRERLADAERITNSAWKDYMKS